MHDSISIVIPTWNAANYVDRVLAALVKQEDVTFEVLVVDNGVVNQETADVVERYAAQYPFVRHLTFVQQLGYAGAVNVGTSQAKFPLVMVMNNDNVPAPNCVKELLKVYRQERWDGKRIAIVSAVAARPGIPANSKGKINFWGRLIYDAGEVYTKNVFPVFYPDGSAFLFDKQKLGIPYESEYFIYHEDLALGWRARLMGYEVLACLDAKVESFDGGSTRRIPYSTAYYSERNRWINHWAFYSWLSILKLLPLSVSDVFATIIFGQNRIAKVHAHLWIIFNIPWLLKYRTRIQSIRRFSDQEILPLVSSEYRAGWGFLNSFTSAYCRLLGL